MRRKKKPEVHHSDDAKIQIAREISATYGSGQYTLDSVCKAYGITSRTLHRWADSMSEVSEALNAARAEAVLAFKERIREKAKGGLERLVEGFYVEEESKETGGKRGKTVVKRNRKYVPPNPTAIIFCLKNTDPENFKDRHETQLTGPNNGPICVEAGYDLTKFSADELATFRTLLEKARSKED